MAPWTCPQCARTFGREGRSHLCKPGMSVEDYVSTAHPSTRPLHKRIAGHLSELDGDLIVDPLDAGIMYKRDAMVAMLTSKTKWTALTVQMPRRIESSRVSRKIIEYGSLFSHVFNLSDADQIDDEMRGWLTEAWYRTDTPRATVGDPMVPDDVDLGPLA